MENKVRVIAFYLPQFHPIPENDKWWGKGFTEWTNVAKARPLYKGHYQPHIPADLGFYDLRLPEIREQQAELAREAGVEGFCYWHYWMGKGKMLLERPFVEVLESGKPDFPFCLGWANGDWNNHTWTKRETFVKDEVIVAQHYSSEDYKEHFLFALKAFKDKRYIRIDDKPLFYIHNPQGVPDVKYFIELWNQLARENGLKGVFFVGRSNNAAYWHIDENGVKKRDLHPRLDIAGQMYKNVLDMGFDAVNSRGMDRAEMIVGGRWKTMIAKSVFVIFKDTRLRRYRQEDIINNYFVKEDANDNVFPTLFPNWDRSPRQGRQAAVCYDSTPEVFEKDIQLALKLLDKKPDNRKILFLQAWNEWGEGNHVEPDLKYGHGYLNVLKKYFG